MNFNDFGFASSIFALNYPSLGDLEDWGWKKLTPVPKKEQFKIKPLTWVLVKWRDQAPTVELITFVPDRAELKSAGVCSYQIATRDRGARWDVDSDQIIAVYGPLSIPDTPTNVSLQGHTTLFDLRPATVAGQVKDLILKHPKKFAKLNEPYRAAMYELGYRDRDGDAWWEAVMEAIG